MSTHKPAKDMPRRRIQAAGNSTVLAIRTERAKYDVQLTKLRATLPTSIKNAGDCTRAEAGLANVALVIHKITTKRDSFIKPLKATMRLLEAEFKPVLAALSAMSDTVRYQLQAWRSVEAEQKEIERQKLEAANAKKRIPVDIAVAVPPQEKTHVTETGSTIQYRKDYDVQVTDITIVPEAYLYPREVNKVAAKAAARLAVDQGQPIPVIPGLTVTQIEVPALTL